ncbi:hypothetical protein AB0K51_13570 [Kitasatospora sp. NPDC049285]|uniref:hypothetical protein n=1 Tax=Kitasatospora sp. NPDC049285 TaxID=3157096 RepID=UPI003448C349
MADRSSGEQPVSRRPGRRAARRRSCSAIALGEHDLRWASAGSLLENRLGSGYAFAATAFGIRAETDRPGPDTVEGVLATRPEPRTVIDPRRLDVPALARELSPRVPADHTYFGLDPATLDRLDAVVFVREIPAPRQWWT